MRKAEHDSTTPGMPPPAVSRPLPLGEQLQPTIERLMAIAAQAADTLFLAEGPPPPDGELLDLSAQILRLARKQNECTRERCNTAAALLAIQIRQLLRRAGKLPAASPAGIYAKALMIGASRGDGAPVLAASLAADLIACRALRDTLWPIDTATGEASHVG